MKNLVDNIISEECSRATYYKIKLSDECLQNIKKYANIALDHPELYNDHGYRLAGHIKKGKQLQLPNSSKELKDYISVISNASVQYYNSYIQRAVHTVPTEDSPYFLRAIQVEDIWLNSYFSGDYNPIHKHGTASPIGLSSFLFVEMPQSIKEGYALDSAPSDEIPGLTGNDHFDGLTLLKWGYNYASEDVVDALEYSQQTYLKPEEGMLYLFPRWMDHMVNPFQGNGKRITIASNVSLWTNKYYKVYSK